MIMEFKKSRLAYFVLFLTLSAFVLLLFIPRVTIVNGIKEYVSFLPNGPVIQTTFIRWIVIIFALFIAHIAASTFATSLGNKEFQKIAAVLLNQCNSTEFLKNTELLLKKTGRQVNLVKYLILGKGYLAEGKFDEVLKISEIAVEEAKVDWITHEMRLNLCGIYQNICIAHVEKNDNQKAISTYSKLKAISADTVGNPNIYVLTDALSLATRDYIAIFAKDGFDDTAAMENHCENATSEYEKVIFSYALARMYARLGKMKEAMNKYRYVAKNGNTFACVQIAKQFLESNKIVK
ncbi:MAG: tetratricopeptide repeat protein [Eubacteriales bacterium]